MAAASQGHLAVVRFLVESGAKNVLAVASNLEYYNRDWSAPGTALMLAAAEGHLDVVRYLVEHLSSDTEMEYTVLKRMRDAIDDLLPEKPIFIILGHSGNIIPF